MVETVERKQKAGPLTREIAEVSRDPFILWVFKVLREGRTGRSRLFLFEGGDWSAVKSLQNFPSLS